MTSYNYNRHLKNCYAAKNYEINTGDMVGSSSLS